MDGEVNRIAAGVMGPGEQLLWAGKPLSSASAQLPWYFWAIFIAICLFSVIRTLIYAGIDSVALLISVLPAVVFFGSIGFFLRKAQSRFLRPANNTFVLTQQRAIHVFVEGATSNIASVPLDANTSVQLSSREDGSGTLLIKRNPGPSEPVATIPLIRPRRTAWTGIRFYGVAHAEYVRDVVKWAIAQNHQQAA
jgi:hypothetical protein